MKTLFRIFLIFFFSVLMIELLYYSLRETIKDYFYETDIKIAEKNTAINSEQSQIILDLAKQQYKMQSGKTNEVLVEKRPYTNKETKQENNTMLLQSEIKTAPLDNIMLTDSKQNELRHKNNYILVDCNKGVVLSCPEYPVITGTSPMFYAEGSNDFLVGRCKNASIYVKSFCP